MEKKVMNGELCVVTGAGGGIGRAIAERMIAEGADVIIGVHTLETAKKIYGDNPQVLDIIEMDATKYEDICKIGEAVAKTGRKVKAVIPVVGGGPNNMIPDITPDMYHLTMDLNVFSALFTVQTVLPYMSDCSSIVLISSIAGFQGGKNAIVYNAAKAAVRSMARSMAGELAERGIRANAISPGPTETEGFTAFLGGNEEARKGTIAMIPRGAIGKPGEIAAIALFLASDESAYVTGAEIIADGGFTNR